MVRELKRHIVMHKQHLTLFVNQLNFQKKQEVIMTIVAGEGKGKEGKGKTPHTGDEKISPVDNFPDDSEPDPDAKNAVLNDYVAPGGMGAFGKFQMHDSWKPEPEFTQRAALWGIVLSKPVTDCELADFITYWKAEGKAFHHDQWQQKLARSVQQSRARPADRQPQRDINAVPEPDRAIPEGFRGYQPS